MIARLGYRVIMRVIVALIVGAILTFIHSGFAHAAVRFAPSPRVLNLYVTDAETRTISVQLTSVDSSTTFSALKMGIDTTAGAYDQRFLDISPGHYTAVGRLNNGSGALLEYASFIVPNDTSATVDGLTGVSDAVAFAAGGIVMISAALALSRFRS